jgi:putative sugar O-methyltransferase
LVDSLENAKVNDEIGDPIRFCYLRAGTISPTTLRYLKVACDLREAFGDLSGFKVVEIGGGYGGQCLLADMLWQLRSWTVFDLDPVLSLISRYLECHLLNSSYRVMTLNRFDDQGEEFDLAISNYAFSELPKTLQEKYVSKVLSKARRGYMNMNSGNDNADTNHMTINELKVHFPDLTVLEEVPCTAAGNYTLIWGKQGQ